VKRRVKFIWGGRRVIAGRWYLGAVGIYDRVVGVPGSGLAISLRGVLLWLTGAAVVGYIGAATALVIHLDRDPHNQVTLKDVLLIPVRWRHYQELRGRSLIEEGRSDLKGGRWSDAQYKLRLGLARSPGDLQARLLLAQFYVASQQRPLARRILAEGLRETFPGQAYLGTMFMLAGQAEDFALIDVLSTRYLPMLNGENQGRIRRWLAETRLKNFFDLGQPARVLESDSYRYDVSGPLRDESKILALIALGRIDDALLELRIWRMRGSQDIDHVLRLLVRAEREGGRLDAMDRDLAELIGRSPGQPAPYVYRVVQRLLAGRVDGAKTALEDYLLRFGAVPENLRLVTEPLAAVGTPGIPLIELVVAAATEQGFETRPLELLHAQALVFAGEARSAKTLLDRLSFTGPTTGVRAGTLSNPLGSSPRQLAAMQGQRDWLLLLAEALIAPTQAAQTALLEGLRSRPLAIAGLRPVVATLRTGERFETAEAVLRWSEGPFPDNRWAKIQRQEIAEILAKAAKPEDTKPSAATAFGEKPFFLQIDQLVAAKNWGAAQRTLRDLRNQRPEPAWLASRDSELLLTQMRVEQGAGERLAMLITAKLYLDGDRKRAEAALALAQEFHRLGAKEKALLLLREILKKSPDFADAVRQLAEWVPKKN